MSLENLREKRRKWVEANKENGFEDGIKRLLTDLYPDNAHFIYELLQNAEDTQASVVRFTLSDSAVEFEHNGERLFALNDVESITSIGVSTKRDDSTSIGKFGVGFKAVFAYTNTPEIHSGDVHFRIHDLVVPETVGAPRTRIGEPETRFVFPFNNPKKKRNQAVEEVERGLRALGDNTLLFLSHIREIEYLLPDGSLGTLKRIEKENGHIEIFTEKSVTQWLRFHKDVVIEDENGESKPCRIAIAYKRSGYERKIDSLPTGQVSIYFPAEKETSNLRFHLHAPFASTVARDSVRDCAANRKLRDHLADLVVESLTAIRDQGMLTVGFLAVLPNPQDNLSAFYEPIREAIVQAFKDDALTPTRSGSHAPAGGLYRGPARIQEVLDDDDLSLLTQYGVPLWAKNPPPESQREVRFLDSLEIDAWGWGELAKVVNKPHRYAYSPLHQTANDQHKNLIETFIAQKEDAWLLRFYALLGEACDTHMKRIQVDDLRIIRVVSDTGNQHAIAGETYFSPEEDTSAIPSDIPFVKPSVFAVGRSEPQKKSAKSFLEQAGVRPYDAKAGIERILEQYRTSQSFALKIHIKHIRQFIRYWKQNSINTDLFEGVSFLVASVNEGRVEETYAPGDLCLDRPYEQTGLAELSGIHKKPLVWAGYQDELKTNGLKDFVDFLKAVGVLYELRVEKTNVWKNPHWNQAELARDYSSNSGTKWTSSAISDDYTISNCIDYLNSKIPSASRLIWEALVKADAKTAKARFRPNQKYDIRESPSQLICHLKSHSWLPDKSGEFTKPGDMTKEDLRTDFAFDDRNGLLTAIGFGENARIRSEEYQSRNRDAQKMGFTSAEEAEDFAKISKEGLTPADIRAFLVNRKQTEQPKQSVPDPDRRRKNVLANTADAPSKESVQQERSVQKGISEVAAQAKAYLRAKYKNPESQLVCQCCQDEMPFKLQSGEHYFEAVQCISDKDARHYQNRLALCPTCAAMYQYARETDDTDLRRIIVEHSADDQADAVEIPVRLASRDHTLRFVGTHWFDLKTVLQGAT